jgi:hypothetical protein
LSPEGRSAIVAALAEAFGEATDVSPDAGQPLHVMISRVDLPAPWASPSRALVRFGNWPSERPEFFVEIGVVNAAGEPPRSNSVQTVLGSEWRQFSFAFPWSVEAADAVRAVMLWLTRFREAT